MIIDFRLRPATRGFLNMHIFRNQERIASWSGKLGMVPPPSAKQGDMELMLKEMEEGGVTLGVVPGYFFVSKFNNFFICFHNSKSMPIIHKT